MGSSGLPAYVDSWGHFHCAAQRAIASTQVVCYTFTEIEWDPVVFGWPARDVLGLTCTEEALSERHQLVCLMLRFAISAVSFERGCQQWQPAPFAGLTM